MSKKRIEYLDVARGIAIILVIIGHIFKDGVLWRFIYSFHMPLFIIVSGYFYKNRRLKDEFIILFKKFFLPMIIILFVSFMIAYLSYYNLSDAFIKTLKTIVIGFNYQSRIDYQCLPVEVLWFIYFLVIMRLLFLINKKIAKDDKTLLLLIVAVEMLIGLFLAAYGYWLPWSVDIVLVCMSFYYFGYLLKKYNLLNRIMNNNKFLLFLCVIWVIGICTGGFELAIRELSILSYISALAGTLVVFKISMIICNKKDKISKFLSWCGRNSLYILFAHFIEIKFLNILFIRDNSLLMQIYLSIIMCSVAILFTYVFCSLKEKWKLVVSK